MKQKMIGLLLAVMMPLMAGAQKYDALWKQVDEAAEKDLPRTQIELLETIAKKAAKGKDYGELLAARMMKVGLQTQISPDSLDVETDRLKAEAAQAETRDKVFAAVYYAVLGKAADIRRGTLERSRDYYDKALADPDLLARQKVSAYKPLFSVKKDSRIFNDDLLHVIALEDSRYRMLYEYYRDHGNRAAACVMASKYFSDTKDLDSLINVYGDLPEAGELAKRRIRNSYKASAGEKIAMIDDALKRWGNWEYMGELKNMRMRLVQSQFQFSMGREWVRSDQEMKLYLKQVRNIKKLKVTFSPINLDGATPWAVYQEKDYKALKSKQIGSVPTFEKTVSYADKAEYDLTNDTLTVPPLPVGTYLIEIEADGKVLTNKSKVYYVSDLYVVSEELPKKRIRYVALNATTGQPVPGAKLRLKFNGYYGKKEEVKVLTADDKGEVVYTFTNREPSSVFVYTDKDRSCPATGLNYSFNYYPDKQATHVVNVFSDRKLYRPGQEVHAAVLVYHREPQLKREVLAGIPVRIDVVNPNHLIFFKKELTTDAYGKVAVDFTLPTSGLTGNFTIRANCDGVRGESYIKVEEYKRPTYDVEFEKYKARYADGDTIQVKGVAKTYSGVPVQGAKVKYKVTRGYAFWWRSYYYYNDSSDDAMTISTGEVKTDGDGSFLVPVALKMPKGASNSVYNFNVEAEVTDEAGESHSATTSLPLSKKSTMLFCNLPARALTDSLKQVTFSYLNAAGQEIDGTVVYTIDDGKPVTVKANQSHRFATPLKSGEHFLKGICGNDTVEAKVMVFALTDKQPVVYTKDWFYATDTQFRKDGKPVYVQIGSSDPDQHILYSVIAGDSLLECGTIDQSNALNTRPFTYKEVYGDGITLNYSWVKNGVCYKHSATIKKPIPDKRLRLEWKTFRNKLLPGQKEQWTLSVKRPDGKPADAQLMATLYDKSLDQIAPFSWRMDLSLSRSLASTNWHSPSVASLSTSYYREYDKYDEESLEFSEFDDKYFDFIGYNRIMPLMAAAGGRHVLRKSMVMEESVDALQANYVADERLDREAQKKEEKQKSGKNDDKGVQMRENLSESAFFYPQLKSDAQGNVNIEFTLPESVTTWKLMGLAHDKTMNYGLITAEAVATKTVMVQPNMPRFVRQGDESVLKARLFNTSAKPVKGIAKLELVDPETDKVLTTVKKDFNVAANSTGAISFPLTRLDQYEQTVLIARTTVEGNGFSDGEQHYLPILPNKEMVTNTVPFTQHVAGVKTVDLDTLFPQGTTQQKLTVEYTDNPTWFLIQALPYVANANDKNAISQSAAFYANSLARYIMNASPNIKQTFNLWKKETGKETSLMSNLQKNESLKELALEETPWVMAAQKESEQKQALMRFFDENSINKVLGTTVETLKKLQLSDGSWTWWEGMPGSIYITTEVSKTFVRLNKMIGTQQETKNMLSKAFDFMTEKMHKEVLEMKKAEKELKKELRPSELAVDYLYVCALDGRELSRQAKEDIAFLVKRMTGRARELTIYGKAMTAVILAYNGYEQEAKDHLQSIREYTVFTDEMGRYFDTTKAYYSWFDYRIPTEVAAIEALKALAPEDRQTVEEMQRWLLMCKRTQAWSTPVNSVNAVFAFSENGKISALEKNETPTALKIDGKPMELPKATAGLGYVKSTVERHQQKTFTAEKTTNGTSWGALYAQFMQPVTDVATAESGIKVVREVLMSDTKQPVGNELKVGDKVTVRITITAERDYDFVQVLDKRAACLEPVDQLSGYDYYRGCYISPRDYTTNFYFNKLSKGKHTITNEYYVDREGVYQTGTCTAQCAYAPEYSGRDKAVVLTVKP